MVIKKLFLAEDDADDMDIFRDTLIEINPDINLLIAKDGLMLLNMLEAAAELPDLIFLDINMPIKNGFQCLQEIRASLKWKNIKIIVLSTSNDVEYIKNAYMLGADLFIPKASSYNEFKALLSKCLNFELDSLRKFIP